MKILKLTVFLAIQVFILFQFYKPEIYTEKVTKDFDGPKEVRDILKTSCYDCHSNETSLTWFDHINPGYLLAREDILQARKYLNFSHWDSLNTNQQRGKLFDALNVIKAGRMPKSEYLFLHAEAKLDTTKIKILEKYILSLEEPVKYDAEKWKKNKEYKTSVVQTKQIEPTLNGIDYIPDYKNWHVISTTDRFDNNTVRIIYANAIGVKAINEDKTNPYPDGSIIAKVVYGKIATDDGKLTAGDYKHVEFMIRDSKKFASTKGWGWARWVGEEKKPYGKDNLFSNECINCHKPVEKRDYVFTLPLKLSQIN